MNRLRAVLFDLDGVLVETRSAVAELWRDLCRREGRPLTDGELGTSVLGCSAEHTVAHLFPDRDTESRHRVLTAVRRAERSLPVTGIAGGAAFVQALAAHDVPMALVTGASTERAVAALRALDLTGCFTALVTWGDVVRGKPHPDCYLLAADRLGLPARQTLVVEDSAAGVAAARGAGAACVAVGPDAPQLVTAGALAGVPSLSGIAIAAPAATGAIDLTVGAATVRLDHGRNGAA